jgi:tRNA threonylcarbamoyladenosine biosynthesis protein TsaB
MNLIGIETSTENCSVALLHAGQITHRSIIAPQKHAELVLGYLNELLSEKNLKKNQIDGIVFGQGPGAFTGVRIAMSIVQGLALALEVPVMAVSTMHNMAFSQWQENPNTDAKLLIANDARMGEVYWASFEIKKGELIRLTDDALAAPEVVELMGYDACAGSAFQAMLDVKSQAEVKPQALPNAVNLLQMAQHSFAQDAQNIIAIQPSYIREKVVFN